MILKIIPTYVSLILVVCSSKNHFNCKKLNECPLLPLSVNMDIAEPEANKPC